MKVKVREDQIEKAKNLYPFESLRGSITSGQGNIFGALGEIIIFDTFVDAGFNVDFDSTYDYDLKIEGCTVDVKTKRTTVTPQPHYLCSISAHNTRQECDFYFFVRVLEDLSQCFLLGYKRKEDFFAEADFNEKGSSDVNGWKFKDDCYNIKIKDLTKFEFNS